MNTGFPENPPHPCFGFSCRRRGAQRRSKLRAHASSNWEPHPPDCPLHSHPLGHRVGFSSPVPRCRSGLHHRPTAPLHPTQSPPAVPGEPCPKRLRQRRLRVFPLSNRLVPCSRDAIRSHRPTPETRNRPTLGSHELSRLESRCLALDAGADSGLTILHPRRTKLTHCSRAVPQL